MPLKCLYLFSFMLIVGVIIPVRAAEVDLDKAFAALDTVVAHRAEYVAEKESKIAMYKRLHSSNTEGNEQYNYCKYLVDEYMKFDPDSAQYYATLCKQIAAESGYNVRHMLAVLDYMFVILIKGQMLDAYHMLSQWEPIENYHQDVQIKLAMYHMEFSLRYRLSEPVVQHTLADSAQLETWEKYGKYLPPKSWMEGYYKTLLTSSTTVDELERLTNSTPQPSIQRAMLNFALGRLYDGKGDIEMATYYYILSAINDVKTANSDVSSLVYLLHSPYIDNSSERAVNYAAACAENVTRMKDTRRSKDVLAVFNIIARAYEDKMERKDNTLTGYIVMLCLLLAVVLIMAYITVKNARRTATKNRELEKMASELESRFASENNSLQQMLVSNEKLKSYISSRNKDFMEVFILASRFIGEMKDGRKAVYNMLAAGNVNQARSELTSTEGVNKDLADFYAVFDTTFLTIYPGFIERFNSLLKPEYHFPTDVTELKPELRIFALVCAGITDSVSIAEFLHYSPQTVYNYRMRIRRRACIDEKGFADTVAHLFG